MTHPNRAKPKIICQTFYMFNFLIIYFFSGPLQSLEPEVECTIDTDSSGLEWHSPSSSLKRKAFIAEALNAKVICCKL